MIFLHSTLHHLIILSEQGHSPARLDDSVKALRHLKNGDRKSLVPDLVLQIRHGPGPVDRHAIRHDLPDISSGLRSGLWDG